MKETKQNRTFKQTLISIVQSVKGLVDRNRMLSLGLALMIIGAAFSSLLVSDWGKVRFEDVAVINQIGTQTGVLYVPADITADSKLPAIVASHGSTANCNTIESWCIELSRRGYVVYAPNLYNHGTSSVADDAYEGTPLYETNGLIDAVEYVYNLPYVDQSRIGVVGHSLGGGSTLKTAEYYTNLELNALAEGASAEEAHALNKVRAIMSVGYPLEVKIDGLPSMSSPDFNGYRCDLGVLLGKYDEFQSWMNKDILTNAFGPKWLKTQTGISATAVEEGKFYYSTDGYCFALWNPGQIHSQAYISGKAIGYVVDFFEETLGTPNPIASSSQVWMAKKCFSAVTIAGFFLFMIAFASALIKTRSLGELQGQPAAIEPLDNAGWKKYVKYNLTGAAISTLIMLPMIILGTYLLPKALWPQNGTNAYALWGCVGGFVTFVRIKRRKGVKKLRDCQDDLGLSIRASNGKFRSFGAALLTVAAAYAVIFALKWFFGVDFRLWNFTVMPFAASKITILLRYLPLFFVFQLANAVNAWQTNWKGWSQPKRIALSTFNCMMPILAMLLISYVPILFIGSPLWAQDGSNLILLALGDAAVKVFSFIMTMSMCSTINILLQKKTGSVWLGAFVNMFWIAMVSVANCSQYTAW